MFRMLLVKSGEIPIPKVEHVQLRNCPEPPYDYIVHKELQNVSGQHLGIKKNRTPDPWWSLACISTVDPNHRFFAKDYVPDEDNNKAKGKEDTAVIDNSDNFFDDLPAIKLTKKQSKKRINRAIVDDTSSQISQL